MVIIMTYENAWLNYRRVDHYEDSMYFNTIIVQNSDRIINSAIEELREATYCMFGITSNVIAEHNMEDLLQKLETSTGAIILRRSKSLHKESFEIKTDKNTILIQGGDSAGILYGVYELLRIVRLQNRIHKLDCKRTPSNPMRMMNHWDNLDGSIERGYSGNSFFFHNNEVIVNERTRMYARLMASIGINATVINNVNVKDMATYLITEKYRERLIQMAEIFADYGIRLFLSLNYAAPVELKELDTADPLATEVKEWWQKKMEEIFHAIPNLGGFLIKADSEGRPGPFTYNRTHADGANMLAQAVKPYGGIIIWRCFVYNCRQDWRDKKTDRARSGYDNFKPLDGKFMDNVILQIKNGPMDFQVREPISPLFGGLRHTNQMLEVQIAQEYTGQQKHVCYLIPMFKEILSARTYLQESKDTVLDIISGQALGQSNCGIAAVANTGDDSNWTGHDLAAANLYGFGRLSYDSNLNADEIAREWVLLTFGMDKRILNNLTEILMSSWQTYEKYNAPLGIGWMVNPSHHYGPNVDGYEYDRWGTYHRADHLGIGVDRSSKGTGYALLYNEPLAQMYNDVDSCPDELLLFFHHVSYQHRLHTNKTVIQHIYDTHFEGVSEVEEMIRKIESLQDVLPTQIYSRMMERFQEQLSSAKEWRDQINTYFYRKSGIEDQKGRKIY